MPVKVKKKIVAILGPTATGKTDLALKLARKFNGELIACDSRQVYTGLDIGTGKLPGSYGALHKGKGFWIIDEVKIWMYDVVSPKKTYTVSGYVKDAEKVIIDITRRGKMPIIVGGTGLYLKALIEGLPNLSIPINKKLRRELQKLSLAELQQKLQLLSLSKWNSLNESDQQNPRRLLRSIEIVSMYGFEESKKIKARAQNFEVLKIGLTAPREVLYKKVDLRISTRLSDGMIEEAKKLNKEGLSWKRMRGLGLEYGVLADYLEGYIKDQTEFIKILQGKIHGYVRRQLTWFKKDQQIVWFDTTALNYQNKVEKKISKWYHSN